MKYIFVFLGTDRKNLLYNWGPFYLREMFKHQKLVIVIIMTYLNFTYLYYYFMFK